MKRFILVEWIDKEDIYHSGVYPESDKKEIEIKLNQWCSENQIKSFDISEAKDLIITN